MEKDNTKLCYYASQHGTHLKTYELFIFGIFHLVFARLQLATGYAQTKLASRYCVIISVWHPVSLCLCVHVDFRWQPFHVPKQLLCVLAASVAIPSEPIE